MSHRVRRVLFLITAALLGAGVAIVGRARADSERPVCPEDFRP
ncbi:hypothetical protein [Pyxidicoccus caerfyrddinensis]|nr:hypothetical protein [Pyxidicoccus caerfyrddinensis]